MAISQLLQVAQQQLMAARRQKRPSSFGGWGAVSAETHPSHLSCLQFETAATSPAAEFPREESAIEPAESHLPKKLVILPDIALAMLRSERAAAGRVWLLLRGLDSGGQGRVSVADVRAKLAGRVCGWRQLRNLLREGNGVFWQRDKQFVWLRSAEKVAAALNVERFGRKAVEFDSALLLGGMANVRAALYATFHTGREDRPIARATLKDLSGVSESSQRQYEGQLGVVAKANYALGAEFCAETQRQAGWQKGNASFIYEDRQGKHGARGKKYVAWRLPNSFEGCFSEAAPKTNRKRNKRLNDLLNLGTTGNFRPNLRKRYCENGSAAVNGGGESYWRGSGAIWYSVQQSEQLSVSSVLAHG